MNGANLDKVEMFTVSLTECYKPNYSFDFNSKTKIKMMNNRAKHRERWIHAFYIDTKTKIPTQPKFEHCYFVSNSSISIWKQMTDWK